MKRLLVVVLLAACAFAQETTNDKKQIPLPTSKLLLAPVPGVPQQTNSLPTAMVISPDGNYLAVLNNGYGTLESKGRQSIGIVDLKTNELKDFPDPRLGLRAQQTYFLGLAWSSDGKHLYASVGSITDPLGEKPGNTGNGIAVYAFENGAVTPERFIKIPLQQLAPGKKSNNIWKDLPEDKAIPYPAGIAVVKPRGEGEQLIVADNLSDDALLIDAGTGKVLHRFDLSTSERVPTAYPYGVVVAGDNRAWVSLWNGSRIAELDLSCGGRSNCKPVRNLPLHSPKAAGAAGSHPTQMLLSANGSFLYVALSNTDEVAVIPTGGNRVVRYLSTRLPDQRSGGAYPNALAQTADALFVANASSDSVAVFPVGSSKRGRDVLATAGGTPALHMPEGFIPTEWYPTALAVHDGELFIASGKGQGTGPNDAQLPPNSPGSNRDTGRTYIASLIHGSVARVNIAEALKNLPELTKEVERSNLMAGRTDRIEFADGRKSGMNGPIKHVIYVIKENRTYDQVFGDIAGANGEPSLVMYGEDITPNQHKLARQFGVLDNFYDSGEISGNGHVWSTAAITSDYTEKTWQIDYRGRERMYDYEGVVANRVPMDDDIPDVNEPGTGYIWTNLARNKRTYRHYGEYVASLWCNYIVNEPLSPQAMAPQAKGVKCPGTFIKNGEKLPDNVGGGPSPYPWPIPILGRNVPTKPELKGHFDPLFPDFRLDYPDQLRADEFLREFAGFVKARAAKKGSSRKCRNSSCCDLPNDHTSGTRPKFATPSAAVADNDLAVGRVADAVSHSPYWDDTAIFVLEDDAQDGADHVDAHRSIALVISKWSPKGSTQRTQRTQRKGEEKTGPAGLESGATAGGGATSETTDGAAFFVDHTFYTTVNLIHTMEVLLGLPPMNNNDARAAVMAPLFSGDGTQPAFTADVRNRDNRLIYTMNPEKGQGAKESAAMDFTHADSVDTKVLNAILWRDRKGEAPMPEPVHTMIGER